MTTNPTPISAPRSQSHTHRQHGCPLRSSPPLRDHGMMRHRVLCDREDPMLTRPCSLPYALPPLPRNLPKRDSQHTKTHSYSSSALPVLVCPRSGTFRTAARGPGTRWTSGTDRVRDKPIEQRRSRGKYCGIWVGTTARILCDETAEESTWLTYARSDGPRPPPHRIPAWTGRSAYCAGWFRAQQWLEGKLHNIDGHTVRLGTYH